MKFPQLEGLAHWKYQFLWQHPLASYWKLSLWEKHQQPQFFHFWLGQGSWRNSFNFSSPPLEIWAIQPDIYMHMPVQAHTHTHTQSPFVSFVKQCTIAPATCWILSLFYPKILIRKRVLDLFQSCYLVIYWLKNTCWTITYIRAQGRLWGNNEDLNRQHPCSCKT
jgi:hypothetical protein